MQDPYRVRRPREAWAFALAALVLVAGGVAPLRAQDTTPPGAAAVPNYRSDLAFDSPYPARLLTIETGTLIEDGVVGFGDARWPVIEGRVEIGTNTIGDAVGVANVAAKVGVWATRDDAFSFVAGGRYYQSYGGLVDLGVEAIAESFSDVTDSEVEVSGWVGYATGTWTVDGGSTHLHLAVQAHRPTETRFAVEDSVAGGGGTVAFEEGEDVSTMWGVDRRVFGRRLVLLLEAGWSWSLERARLGFGVDAGSQRWRVTAGVTYPGVETDLATDPTDLVVTPVLSVHYRF